MGVSKLQAFSGMPYNLVMLLSPFRIRLFLALPLIACCWGWIYTGTQTREGAWISWDRTYLPDYFPGGPTSSEWKLRWKMIHESHLDLPGFHYAAQYIDASAPAPFASKCRFHTVSVHFALLTALLALPLATYFVFTHKRRRAASRLARGLCPRCGYDLRATPERCPECGTTIPQNAFSSG